jgi:hypothetical protein
MKSLIVADFILSGLMIVGSVEASSIDDLLRDYRGLGAGSFDAAHGRVLWERSFPSAGGPPRSCTSCHTRDPRAWGRHAVTGKRIEPIAPSVSAKRLTQRRQIEKWLKRNCNWTLGRDCSPQEKGDLLSFLRGR